MCDKRFMAFTVVLLMIFAGLPAMSMPIDSAGVSSTMVVRKQLHQIAMDVVDSAHIDMNRQVAVVVEGDGPRMLAENALIEALQNRHCMAVVIDTTSVSQILYAFVFRTSVKLHPVDDKYSERNTQTVLEARVVKGANRRAQMLGSFYRETNDTAQVYASPEFPDVQKNEEDSIFQRMMTPFIIIGGAIVIVYLFFTVRS
jgi:hypothetical protein